MVWTVREVLGPNPRLSGWHASFIVSHARRVVAISDAVRECFPKTAGIDRVYNAVDLAEFSGRSTRPIGPRGKCAPSSALPRTARF